MGLVRLHEIGLKEKTDLFKYITDLPPLNPVFESIDFSSVAFSSSFVYPTTSSWQYVPTGGSLEFSASVDGSFTTYDEDEI